MCFHGVKADAEVVGDFLVGAALGDHHHHFVFTGGEVGQETLGEVRGAFGDRVGDMVGGRQVRPRGGGPNR